jgi:hypothetical protein
MKRRLLLLPFSVLAFALAANAAAVPVGGFAGSWSANFEKSKFPGPPPKVDGYVLDQDGTITVSETGADGHSTSWHYTAEEGKAVPVIGRDNVTVTVHKVSDHVITHSWNMNGKPAKSKSVLSKDGKTTTFTMDGTDKEGKPFHEMVVFDKQ